MMFTVEVIYIETGPGVFIQEHSVEVILRKGHLASGINELTGQMCRH